MLSTSYSLAACTFLLSSLLATVVKGQTTGQEAYFVDGNNIPGLDSLKVSDSYAGLLPFTAYDNVPRQYFFWWYPAEGAYDEDLVIWLNGGPGCSSLEGLLQENGPFLFPYNSSEGVLNPFSWTKLSNVLYIDQPTGAGLSKGTPDALDQTDIAKKMYAFLSKFMQSFPQLKGKKLWLTGESFAGKYIPYMVDYITSQPAAQNEENGINYQGFLIHSPGISSWVHLDVLPTVEFAARHQKTLRLNDSFVDQLKRHAVELGIGDYVRYNLHYPSRGPIKYPINLPGDYQPWIEVRSAARNANKNFNIYDISKTDSQTYDPLGFPLEAYSASAVNIVNNITGLIQYIHADPQTVWYECRNDDDFHVFIGDGDDWDPSPYPADNDVLQRAIEHSPAQRSVLIGAEHDFRYLTDGLAVVLQNTTWNGMRGFQRPLANLYLDDGSAFGTFTEDRGLTFARVPCGHMIPQFCPELAFKMQRLLLGQITHDDLRKVSGNHSQ